MTPAPAALDAAGIAARIPHAGGMCLLDALLQWDAVGVRCSASSHHDAANPLRCGGLLHAAAAVEYASQAMALHGSLGAAPGAAARAGFLASVRGVRLAVARLDDVEGPLVVSATRLAGDAGQAMYAFEIADACGRRLVDGRATVILDARP